MNIMNTLMFWKKPKTTIHVGESNPIVVPVIQEQNIDDLIKEASKVVLEEENNLSKILENCEKSIDENYSQKNVCTTKHQKLIEEKENIEAELPSLKACNSIKGIERREMRLLEIINELDSLTSIITELDNNIKELSQSKLTTEKEYTKKINDIKIQINSLKAKKHLSEAEQITNSALSGLNISGSKLTELDKKLQKASTKIAIERRLNSLNIPLDQQ